MTTETRYLSRLILYKFSHDQRHPLQPRDLNRITRAQPLRGLGIPDFTLIKDLGAFLPALEDFADTADHSLYAGRNRPPERLPN